MNSFIIFLDIDGVLNCELFYESRIKDPTQDSSYHKNNICKDRILLLNDLCNDINAKIVISSTWRKGRSVEELQKIMNDCGGTFEIIDKTDNLNTVRGVEIQKWLKDNISVETHGCHYSDFNKYAIIDDDSDMLLEQSQHYFQTDFYSGLTNNTCYRIKRFSKFFNS